MLIRRLRCVRSQNENNKYGNEVPLKGKRKQSHNHGVINSY